MPVWGCWWWQHSQVVSPQLGDTVSSLWDLWHSQVKKASAQQIPYPWQVPAGGHTALLTLLWELDSFTLRPQWGLHLQRPQSHKSHGGETAGHRSLSKRESNSTKASALSVDLQLQSRQWALWHWCGPTAGSDVLQASWNYTSCLQKQERQAAMMGSRVTSGMVGRHLPMHMAW